MSITKAITQPFVKIYNFIQRVPAQLGVVDYQGKFIPYNHDTGYDNFPNYLASLVENSPTATSCLSTTSDFVTGEGFNLGADLENRIINDKGLKFFQFHAIQADTLVHNWGVATLVRYNRVGQITQMQDIPFAYCRLGKPDDKGVISKIVYNPYFGTHLYDSKDNVEYDVYNPSAAPVQATKPGWKGQINWMGIRDRKNPYYPVPDYYSAKHWMNVEKNAGVYFDENLENGFLQSAVMKLIGDPNDPSGLKDDQDKDIPKGVAFDKAMKDDFSGAKRNAMIWAMWGSNKEEWPELEAFPTNGNAEMHKITDEHAIKKITVATKVPAILANISEGVSLGGDGNTIRAAVKLMQQRVKRMQAILIDYYADMLGRLVTNPIKEPISIVPYNPFPELEAVDPLVWAEMTPEERRKWIKDHTEIELTDGTPEPAAPATPVENVKRFQNLHFDSYPKKARENVKRALDWQEKMGAKCSKPKGREMSERILNGVPLGPQDIKRLSRYLSKQTVYASHPYSGDSCESVLYDAWGGSEMMVWANEKMNELNGKAD